MLLGQLVYTSFSEVGFQALMTDAVPLEIRRLFVDEIVYPHWDSYNPPSVDYRAVYLYRVTLDQTIFGWLYNDGVDDFGRSHVPYFVAYYLTGALQLAQLETIFRCLATGPMTIVDRCCQSPELEAVVCDLQSYEAARLGVEVAASIQEQSSIGLQQGKLFKLFVSGAENEEHEGSIPAELQLTQIENASIAEKVVLWEMPGATVKAKQPTTELSIADRQVLLDQLLERSQLELYQQLLLSKMWHSPKRARVSFKDWRWVQRCCWWWAAFF